MSSVQYYFDFGSPNAYLSHRVIPGIEQRTGAHFDYLPMLLGGVFKLTNNRSPVEAYADVRNKLDYQRLEMQRFIAAHGLSAFRSNPHFPVNTLHLMRGAVAAAQLDVAARYIEAMFCAMWEQQRNMADAAEIRAVLVETGLPADELIVLSADPAIKQTLVDNTAAAVERGVFGAPTFFVGDAMYFGKDRLHDVEQLLLAQPA